MTISNQLCREAMEHLPTTADDHVKHYAKFRSMSFINLMKKNDKAYKEVLHQLNEEIFHASFNEYQAVVDGIEKVLNEAAEDVMQKITAILSE